MTRAAPVLAVRGLTVRYGATTAVDGVDLDLLPGTMTCVIGASGAGKTSLLQALSGRLVPAAGVLTPAPHAVVAGARTGIATVPQGFGLVHVLTALENVGTTVLPGRPADARRAALAALAAVGLDDAAAQLVDELSGGQQQRVAVARALARRAAIVLADEPTTELDVGNRARVLAVLRAEAADGAAVVVTTNDPDPTGFDVVLSLADGVLQWAGAQG